MAMTLSDFVASRRDGNPRDIVRDDYVSDAGFIYGGDAYIEKVNGELVLTLGNESWATPETPLTTMEALLYAWCLSECGADMGMREDVAAFVNGLQDAMTSEQFAAALLANRDEANGDICHMHDYCDANQVALDAVEEIASRKGEPVNDDTHVDDAAALYDAARPFLRGVQS